MASEEKLMVEVVICILRSYTVLQRQNLAKAVETPDLVRPLPFHSGAILHAVAFDAQPDLGGTVT